MAIKTLIYSALSLGIASGATVGGYFIFKPDTTKQESNTQAQEGASSQSSSTNSVTPERVTSDSQPLSQGTGPVQNQVTERRDSASPGTAITPNSSSGDRGPSGP